MPIYSYRCDSCGHHQDVLQKMSDPLLSTCPHCQQVTFKKQLTAPGFQLKGSGWYATDFRGNSAPAAQGTPSNDTPSNDSGASSTSANSSASSDSTSPPTGCGTSCGCH